MATANVKKQYMEMEITEISKLEEVWSPEMLLHGVPWKVKVCKREQSLAAFLHCDNKDKSPNWSLSGSASFKLLPVSGDANAIEYHVPPYVFDASRTGYGNEIIKWNDLFKQDNKYVKNDTINLEVKINAENPNGPNRSRLNFECIHKCCDNSSYAKFRLTVSNVLNLMAVPTPTFTICGWRWHIEISKTLSSHLGVLLLLNKESAKESSNMTMSIKLVSSKKDVHPIEKCITKQYQYPNSLDVTQIVSWDEMIKAENGFVNNNAITLETEIYSEKPKGDVKSNPKAEVKLLHMECAVCLECIDSQDLSVTPCGHLFCLACITKVVTDRGICPTCKTAVQLTALRRFYLPIVN